MYQTSSILFLCIFLVTISSASAKLEISLDTSRIPRVALNTSDTTLGDLDCSNSQIAKFNSSSNDWYCAKDEIGDLNQSVANETYLNLSGTNANQDVNITIYDFEANTVYASDFCYLNGTCVSSGGFGDNLGNHIATQDLDMANFGINKTGYINVSGKINTSNTILAKDLVLRGGNITFNEGGFGGFRTFLKTASFAVGDTYIDLPPVSSALMTLDLSEVVNGSKIYTANNNHQGNETFTGSTIGISADLLHTSNLMTTGKNIEHDGDSNTGLIFTNDDIEMEAGGLTFIKASEANEDVLLIGSEFWDNITIGNKHGVATIDATYVLINSSANVTNNLTGNFYYGEMWNKTDAGVTIDLKTQNVYENVTGLINGSLNGFTIDKSNLTSMFEGTYRVDYSISFFGTANSLIGFDVGINGVDSLKCHSQRDLTQNNIAGNTGSTCFIKIKAGDIITMMARDENNPVVDISVVALNINIFRVGD